MSKTCDMCGRVDWNMVQFGGEIICTDCLPCCGSCGRDHEESNHYCRECRSCRATNAKVTLAARYR